MKIYAYQIDTVSGALTPVPGSPFAVTGTPGNSCTPADMVLTPNQQFFYTACQNFGNDNGEAVAGFSVNSSNGALTALSGSPYPATVGGAVYGLVITPDGNHLFGLSLNSPSGPCPLDMWSVGSNGALVYSSGAPYQSSNFASQFTGQITPDAKFLYIGVPQDSNSTEGVSIVPLAATTAVPNIGASTEFSATGGQFGDTKLSVDTRYLAVGTSAITHVYNRNLTTGALSEIGTGSALAGTGVVEIVQVAN